MDNNAAFALLNYSHFNLNITAILVIFGFVKIVLIKKNSIKKVYLFNNYVDKIILGTEKLSHPHNLVYINVLNNAGMHNIESFKFGHNIYYKRDFIEK